MRQGLWRRITGTGGRGPKAASLAALSSLALFASVSAARAGEARIAAAANFTAAAKAAGAAFEKRSGHRITFSFASTGQLYAQISQGAPFDAFLAADQARARKAIENGLAVKDSAFTYATGRIVLFSAKPGRVRDASALTDKGAGRVAIANPLTAPYGAAAVAAMKSLGVYGEVKGRLVRGNNIAQTFQFVATGNADIGFVALSQVTGRKNGSWWIVPQKHYAPIAQDAVLLKRGKDNTAASEFLRFLKSDEGRQIIQRFGYGAGA